MTERPLLRRATQEPEHRERLPTPVSDREILGRYEVQEVIQGVNSNIYKAKDIETNRTVAVKEVAMSHCSYAGSQKPLDLALREFKVGQNLRHDNLTTYLECNFDEEVGRVLLIRDWVEGISLRDFIEQGKKLSSEQIQIIMDCVIDAVAYLHEQGIIHRDIKPANIIVEFDEQEIKTVKLIDLGAVSEHSKDQSSQLTTCIGTPGYMALEARTTPITQSDLFSIGATLLYLICRKDADDILDRKGRYQIPEDLNGNFRIALEKTLQVAVEKRVQTAEQLKAILHKGRGPTWTERKRPVSSLKIKQIENIIASDSFPALPIERQDALIASCLKKFFANKDLASVDTQKTVVLERIAGHSLSENTVNDILSDMYLYSHFTAEQKAMMAGRITDEENAKRLLEMEGTRDCPELEGVLAARIHDAEKASKLLRWVVRSLGAQQILADRIRDEKGASEILGLDQVSKEVVAGNPGAQRILVSKINDQRIAARLLEKACVSDPEAQKALVGKIDGEQLAGRMLHIKAVAANPEAEAILVSRITDQRYLEALLKENKVVNPQNQAMLIDRVTDEEAAGRVILSKAVYGNPEAEMRLASKISRQEIAGGLLGAACVSDAGAQITLAEKITDVRHAPKLKILRALCPQVQRDLVSRLRPPPNVGELINNLTDPQAQQIAAEKVEESKQAFAVLSSGVARNNPELQRTLVQKIQNEDTAEGLLQAGNVTDTEAERILASRITEGNRAFELLLKGTVKGPEAQKALACSIEHPKSAMKLLTNPPVWARTATSALYILINTADSDKCIQESDALAWLLDIAKDPQLKEALMPKIRTSESAEILLMRGIFKDEPEAERYLVRLIRQSATAHKMLMSGEIADSEAKVSLAAKVSNEGHAYTLLMDGRAQNEEVQRTLAERIRSKRKIQRLLQSGIITDPETLERLRSI